MNYSGSKIINGTVVNEYVSDEEYAEIFRKTKISLCFTDSIFGAKWKQRKGRVSESAACQSFMLMTNPEIFTYKTGKWFEEGVHFDSINEQNCVDKIKYYLDNPEKRESMAKQFHERWLELCSPSAYWNQLFKWSKDK